MVLALAGDSTTTTSMKVRILAGLAGAAGPRNGPEHG
jgi:hypothetical protein